MTTRLLLGALVVLNLCCCSSVTVPSAMADHPDGWMEMGLNYTAAFEHDPAFDIGHNGGLYFRGASHADWGLGMSLVLGENLLEINIDALLLPSPFGADVIDIPVVFKLGWWLPDGVVLALETGVKVFFGEIVSEAERHSYFTGEFLGGVHTTLVSFSGESAEFFSRILPTAAINLGLAFPPPPPATPWEFQ